MKVDRETDELNYSMAESKVIYSNCLMKAAPRNCSDWISCLWRWFWVRDFINTKQKIFASFDEKLFNYFN